MFKRKKKNQYDAKRERTGYWENYSDVYYSTLNRLLRKKMVISKGNYVDGERAGYWEEFWFNRRIYSKGHYENGNKIGYWEVYSSDGILVSHGHFGKRKNGYILRSGAWKDGDRYIFYA